MKKSVYSLVLSDEVVAQIDRLAYEKGTNRSNAVNQILAEYVSYVTPEKRIGEVFDRIGDFLSRSDTFRLAAQPSDRVMTLRSALAYKYNPTVRYSVELYRNGQGAIGVLRVSMRTQSEALLQALDVFFRVFMQTEQRLIGECRYQVEPGRFCRELSPRYNRGGLSGMVSSNDLGDLITQYIRTFDGALKAFFALSDQPAEAEKAVQECYMQYLHRCGEIL